VCVLAHCSAGTDGEKCAGADGLEGLCCAQTCIDPLFDANNCAQCHNACGAGSLCDYGSCIQATSCTASTWTGLCATGAAGNSSCCGPSCANLNADPANCGHCGYVCPAAESCIDGSCGYDGGGTFYCGSGPDAGCPAGTACSLVYNLCLPQSCPTADQSACAAASGLGQCCATGACTDPQTSDANCGYCGNACPSGQHCMQGSCQ
jgi:hypothetical protein